MHAQLAELKTPTVCLKNPNPSFRLSGVCGWFEAELGPQIYRGCRWWCGWPYSGTWLVKSGWRLVVFLGWFGIEKWGTESSGGQESVMSG